MPLAASWGAEGRRCSPGCVLGREGAVDAPICGKVHKARTKIINFRGYMALTVNLKSQSINATVSRAYELINNF